MSQQEMDQMDREVMALVNDRQTEQEDTTSVKDGAETPAPQEEGFETEAPCNDKTECDSDRLQENVPGWLTEKDGMYCISKEKFAALEAEVKKEKRRKNLVRMAVCIVLMGVLFVAFCRPELLNYIVSAGAIACSVTIGVCLERLVEANR